MVSISYKIKLLGLWVLIASIMSTSLWIMLYEGLVAIGVLQLVTFSCIVLFLKRETQRKLSREKSLEEILCVCHSVLAIWQQHVDDVIVFSTAESKKQAEEIKAILACLDSNVASLNSLLNHIELIHLREQQSQYENEVKENLPNYYENAINEIHSLMLSKGEVDEKIARALVSLQNHDRVCQALNLVISEMKRLAISLSCESTKNGEFNAEKWLKNSRLEIRPDNNSEATHSLLSSDKGDKNNSNVTFF